MLRITLLLLITAVASAAWLSRPLPMDALPNYTPDPAAGERLFLAGGCASCHATPVNGKRAQGDDKLRLGGGLELETDYGTFRVPNISPHDENGIGSWTGLDFVNAMQRGVSPGGNHYYPSFPYPSYTRMPVEDVLDLKAYIDTLPAADGGPYEHSLSLPWSIRRGIGLWKRRYVDAAPVVEFDESSAELELGRRLVEGVGHCGECHTPRDRFGGAELSRWLAGAASADGPGRVPNITPAGNAVGEWSVSDLAYYFETGFTPDFDTVGGSMVAVQENLARLTARDRVAIATYLKSIPAVASSADR